MKEKIKKIIPNKLLVIYRKINEKNNLKKAYKHDMDRFYGSIPKNKSDSSLDQLEASLIFHSHALEKGFSHNDFRENFGKNALKELSLTMNAFLTQNYDKNNYRYRIALSAIKNYIGIHEKKKITPYLVYEFYSSDLIDQILNADEELSGVKIVNKNKKQSNKKLNYKELSENRVSIREYSDEKVDIKDIEQAVLLSMNTPSVCNRQPSRVLVIEDKEKIEAVLKIQGGYNGFSVPPILLLVTTDNQSFIEINERNQGFIDGGLFSMSLLNSLEYVGLGACALNAMLTVNQEKNIKEILDISIFENLIMFVSVGHILDFCKVPKSSRDNFDRALRIIK